MARKKRGEPAASAEQPGNGPTILAQSLPTLPAPVEERPDAREPGDDRDEEPPATGEEVGTPADGDQPRQWANPYRAVFTSTVGGLEVGEDRRFKQVVVGFADRPGQDVTDRLKAAGFRYRAAERSWTAPASAAAREFALTLGQELHLLAGGNTVAERGR